MISEKIKNYFLGESSAWIMYNSENCDPYFKRFITDNAGSVSACIVSGGEVYLFANELDEYNLKGLNCDLHICRKGSGLIACMLKMLENLGFPQNIYLNYSDTLDVSTDILGHGLYSFLTGKISEFYCKKKKKVFYRSADNIIYDLVEAKSQREIEYMKLSAKRALQILEDTFKKIKAGMTEKDIFDLCHDVFSKKPEWFKDYGIVDEKFSWEEKGCPIVLVGPDLKKGGHTLPSSQKLEKGHTIYLDFGVALLTDSGEKYSSDLQRMGYCKKDGETDAPDDVKKVFRTLKEAIKLGAKKIEPNKKGFEIDEEVRKYILSKGYPDYNHATGHPVGQNAHDLGASLSARGSKKSNLYLKENGIYTIEPRIQIENGGSIEEMILVTKQGGKPLCDMQESLYLV